MQQEHQIQTDVPIQWTWISTGQASYLNIHTKNFEDNSILASCLLEKIFSLQQPFQCYLKRALNHSAAAIAAHAAFRRQSTRRQVALV